MHYSLRSNGPAPTQFSTCVATAIQDASVHKVFKGLLVDFPAILDSFSAVPQALLHRGGGWGVGGGVNASQNFTLMS